MRSLTLKLMLAFIGICLIEALLVAFFTREATQRAFDRFVEEEAIQGFIDDVLAHYERAGSWEGLEASMRASRRRGPVPRPNVGLPPPAAPGYALADLDGYIVKSNDRFRRGQQVTSTVLDTGQPLFYNGERLGTILFPERRAPLSQGEIAYMRRTDTALVLAVLGSLVLSLMIGILVARTYTRPIRRLTAATRAMARGDLEQQVSVQSQDELGELTAAFNQMSTEVASAHATQRQMTADIAHDLRTPLTALTGYLEAMRDGILEPTPRRFETMYAEVSHLNRLVEDLRTLSLADAGALPLARKQVSAEDLLDQTARTFSAQATEKQISLKIETPASSLPIQVDPDRMAQVLGNLVGNALRYTPAGGSIRLRAYQENDGVCLAVQDTGTGIPEEALPYIFDRFYRVDPVREHHRDSSGLGLAIARSIVDAHGGALSVDSIMGQGTTFTIRLQAEQNR